ncbi:Chorismate mutase [Thermoplasmatales archaeon BRNA1]|nr:Chorismate mutase [Thermoplasmatales archaeon BRNA1]
MSDYLETRRQAIADIDMEILALLRKRLDLAVEIGHYKAEHGMEVLNPGVQDRVIARYRKAAEELGLDPDRCETICRTVMEESIAYESAIISEAKKNE